MRTNNWMRTQRGISVVSLLLIVVVLISAAVFWKRDQSAKQKAAALAEYRVQEEQRLAKEKMIADEARLAEERAESEAQARASQLKAETEKAIASLADAAARFTDGVKLAKSTARIALSGPVAALQKIMRETEALVVPACIASPQRKLVEGMSIYVESFMLFMNDPKLGEFKAMLRMNDGALLVEEAETGLKACVRAAS